MREKKTGIDLSVPSLFDCTLLVSSLEDANKMFTAVDTLLNNNSFLPTSRMQRV